MKYLLPLIFFSFLSVAQDSPKIDPNTGLPLSNNNGNTSDKLHSEEHKWLVELLNGISPQCVVVDVLDSYKDVDKSFIQSIEGKLQLFLKRNKLDKSKWDPDGWLHIRVEVASLTLGNRTIGYDYIISIGRFVRVGKSENSANQAMHYRIKRAVCGASQKDRLLLDVETTLDKIALAILDLPEPKKK